MRQSAANAKNSSILLSVRRSPLDKCKGILQAGPVRLRAALGRSGITSLKREGDGATPRATMKVLGGYCRKDQLISAPCPLPVSPIRSDALWCDAPGHGAYNRPVRAPFSASHEKLMRKDRLYDICMVLDWNVASRRRNAGSAIFFHIAKPDYAPTEGCVAISLKDMQRLLPYLKRGSRLRVI